MTRHCMSAVLLAALAVLCSGCGQGRTRSDPVGATAADAEVRAATEAEVARLRERVAWARKQARASGGSSASSTAPGSERVRPPNPTAGGMLLSAADGRSFARFAASLPGAEGLAVSAVGVGRPVQRLGSIATGIAWSTSKVPVAMAAVDAGVADPGDLTAAITASDNEAAMRLWQALGGGAKAARAADAELRAAGDTTTRIEPRTLRAGLTPFGQTDWALAAQARFTAGMTCLASGAKVLALMGRVVADQRFGLGSAGVRAQFKGGWGPGSRPGRSGGYLDRQMGVMVIAGKPVAVAIASLPSDGSDATGRRNLTRLARWVARHINTRRLPIQAAC